MEWTIYTSSAELMYKILVGIGHLFDLATSEFYWLLGGMALLGLYLGFVKSWMDEKEQPIFKWVMTVTIIFVSITAKVDILIEDPDAIMTIDEMPVVVVLPAFIFSNIRHSMEQGMGTAFGGHDDDKNFDPTNALAKLRDLNVAKIGSEAPYVFYSGLNYWIDCISRDIDTFGESMSSVKLSKLYTSTPETYWPNAKVNYAAWQTTVFDKDNNSFTKTCPDAHAHIGLLINSGEFKASSKEAFESSGTKLAYLQSGLDDITNRVLASGVTAHKTITMRFFQSISDQAVGAGMEFQYALQKFQANESINSKSVFQYVFSARNTQMFMMFLELLTILIVPILLIIALISNNFSALSMAGMFSFIPLVTSACYVPVKLMMHHFYVTETALSTPLSWVQMSSTINDAESAIASAAALSLMIPSLITMVANKLFNGASAAGSALSAANRNDVDTSKISPEIASSPNGGTVNFGNQSASTNTAAGMEAMMNGPSVMSTQTGNSPFKMNVTSGNSAQTSAAKSAAHQQTAQAQSAHSANFSNIIGSMETSMKGVGAGETSSGKSTSQVQLAENAARQISKDTSMDLGKVREMMAATSTGTNGSLGFSAMGTGAGLTYKNDETSRNGIKEQLSQGSKNANSFSQSEIDAFSAALETATSSNHTWNTTDAAKNDDTFTNAITSSKALSDAQATEDKLSKQITSTQQGSTSWDIASGTASLAMANKNSTFDSLVGGKEGMQKVTEALKANGDSRTAQEFLSESRDNFIASSQNDMMRAGMDGRQIEQMGNMKAIGDLFSKLESSSNSSDVESVKNETGLMKDIASNMEKATGQAAYGEMSKRWEAQEQMLTGGVQAVANEAGVNSTQIDGNTKDGLENAATTGGVALGAKVSESHSGTASAIKAVDPASAFGASKTELSDKKNNSSFDAKYNEEKAGVERGSQTPEESFYGGLNASISDRQGLVFNDANDSRLDQIKDGIGVLANSSIDQVTDILNDKDSTQRDSVLAAMGAEGKQIQSELKEAGNGVSINMEVNAAAAESWIGKNSNDLLDTANGTSAVLSNNGSDFGVDNDRTLASYDSGKRDFSPEHHDALKDTMLMASDAGGGYFSSDVDNPNHLNPEQEARGFSGVLASVPEPLQTSAELGLSSIGKAIDITSNALDTTGGAIDNAIGVNPIAAIADIGTTVGEHANTYASLLTGTDTTASVTASSFLDQIDKSSTERLATAAATGGEGNNYVEQAGNWVQNIVGTAFENEGPTPAMTAARELIAGGSHTQENISGVASDHDQVNELRSIGDSLANNGFREEAEKIYDFTGKNQAEVNELRSTGDSLANNDFSEKAEKTSDFTGENQAEVNELRSTGDSLANNDFSEKAEKTSDFTGENQAEVNELRSTGDSLANNDFSEKAEKTSDFTGKNQEE